MTTFSLPAPGVSRLHHRRRAVVDEFGRVFASAALAADHHGMSPSTCYLRARYNRFGWRFVADEEVAAGRAEPNEG